MRSANRSASELVRLQARVEWLIRRLEAFDARLLAVEMRRPPARKLPQSRAATPPAASAAPRGKPAAPSSRSRRS